MFKLEKLSFFAVDTKVRNEERFAGKKILRVPVAAPIKDAEKIIKEALALVDIDS